MYLENDYSIQSNWDSINGRYDVSLIPKLREHRPLTKKDRALCIEFKVKAKDEENLVLSSRRALEQIEKNYIQTILDAGVPREQIRCFGIAFHGREVFVGDGSEPVPEVEKKKKAGRNPG